MPKVANYIRRNPHLAEIMDASMVQVDEAHASDKWPRAYSYEVPSAKTIQDKHSYAMQMARDFGWEWSTYVDASSVSNGSFQSVFSAWPDMYVVFHKGMVSYIGQASRKTKGRYDLTELLRHIDKLAESYQ